MIRRRASAWATLLERADDELVAALDSLASLFRGDDRSDDPPRPGRDVAELHKRAWALGLKVALAGDGVVLVDPGLRDEAAQIGGLWRELHPARGAAGARAEARPAAELLRKVDDLKLRLAQLQDRMGVVASERAGQASAARSEASRLGAEQEAGVEALRASST